MSVSDPISDMLVRMRNALSRGKASVRIPYSRFKFDILEAFKREGYIARIVDEGKDAKRELVISFKYGENGESAITEMTRDSKPSRKVYKGCSELIPIKSGFGNSFVSTSKGILSDKECREARVGGELICTVW